MIITSAEYTDNTGRQAEDPEDMEGAENEEEDMEDVKENMEDMKDARGVKDTAAVAEWPEMSPLTPEIIEASYISMLIDFWLEQQSVRLNPYPHPCGTLFRGLLMWIKGVDFFKQFLELKYTSYMIT